MKRYQKTIAIALALSLVLSSLTACGDKAPKPRTAGEVAKDAVSMVDTKLSETEMRAAIDSYAAALTEALVGGNAAAKFVDNKDGSVALVVQAEGVEETQELMKFGSVKEAFSYFVYTGQMDADGKNITPPVVQTVSGNEADTSTAAPDATQSETTSEISSAVTSAPTESTSAPEAPASETSTPEAPAPAPESAPAESVAAPLPDAANAPA